MSLRKLEESIENSQTNGHHNDLIIKRIGNNFRHIFNIEANKGFLKKL